MTLLNICFYSVLSPSRSVYLTIKGKKLLKHMSSSVPWTLSHLESPVSCVCYKYNILKKIKISLKEHIYPIYPINKVLTSFISFNRCKMVSRMLMCTFNKYF